MRRHIILFFSALFFLISCKDKTAGDIIEKDKMAHILSDVHIIDATMASYGAKDSLFKYGTKRYAVLFKQYGVDSALFNRSLKYYSASPDEMIAMYDSVNAILKTKTDSIGKVQNKLTELKIKRLEAQNKRKADSLRRDSISKATKAVKLKTKQTIL